ncbi:MAG: hypothetical protein OEY30_03470 [Candidatus Bathyarchaeota archaeon]|nr:hypothetical protein [Candidatus Bathyarchaeota archaeon]
MAKHKRVAVGFYKDEDGKTRPITKPSVKRKQVIEKPRRFKGVGPRNPYPLLGKKVLVTTKQGEIFSGYLRRVDKDGVRLSFAIKGKHFTTPQWLPKRDIFKISVAEHAKGVSPLSARKKISELEARSAKIDKQIHGLEEKMFEAEGRRADVFYRQVKALQAQQKDIDRQIDQVLDELPREEQKKLVREQFAAARVMVERELGGKLTTAEKWAGKRLYRKKRDA